MWVRVLLLLCFLVGGCADGAPVWDYRVDPSPDLEMLHVEACLRAPGGSLLTAGASDSVEALQCEVAPGRWQALADATLPAGSERRWHLRYRLAIGALARAERDADTAGFYGGVLVSPCSTWLLHPEEAPAGDYRLQVVCPSEVKFLSGVHRRGQLYQAAAATLEQTPAAVFGKFRVTTVAMAGGVAEIVHVDGALQMDDASFLEFLRSRVRSVAAYFGRFPVQRVLVVALPKRGGGTHGVAMGNGGASVVFLVPDRMSGRQLQDSWELTHELVHLGLPGLDWQYHWAEEGLATYLEPIIRGRGGEMTAEQVWGDLLEGARQSADSERGLDGNHDWAQTYWGGAVFWLLADVRIRVASGGHKSLQDALQAVVRQGGNLSQEWPFEKVLQVGDEAVGLRVLRDLYAQMGPQPGRPNMDDLWERLGIRGHDSDDVRFFSSSLSWIRQAILRPERKPAS